jgi:putative ABC transport system permease protein
MKELLRDLWYAARLFARSPGFTICIVLTLALGIGVNTAIFSVVRGVLLRPLPYTHGDGLLHVGALPPGPETENVRFSVPELHDLAKSRTLAGLAEYHAMPFTLLGRGEPDRVQIGVVSANFFTVFGVQPLLGRTFVPGDEAHGTEPVLLLTYEYWRRRFGGDPGIVGQRLRLNDEPIQVVGVLPPLPQYPGKTEAFMPTVACPTRSSERVIENRRTRMLTAFARLKPGATFDQAQAELALLSSRMRQANPGDYDPEDPNGIPLLSVREELVGHFRPLLLILLGIVGLVLLVACANVANLILARLSNREHELGVRAAMGADRSRLARQLLTEAVLLAAAGGALGLLLAAASVRLLAAFASRFTVRTQEIGIDPMVLLFVAGLAVLTGLAVGIAPAVRASPRRLAAALRAGVARATPSRASLRLRGVMVIAQVAVSFVLLVIAGLLLRTVRNLQRVNPGFDSSGVVVIEVPLPMSRYAQRNDRLDFFDRLFGTLHKIPGVQSAAISGDVPLTDGGGTFVSQVEIEGRAEEKGEPPEASFHIASEEYFRTLGIPLLEGRSFTVADRGDATPVAVVNRAMQRRFWPGVSPLGRRFVIPFQGADKFWTVVGVVGDVKQYGLNTEDGPAFYVPYGQIPGGGQVFVRMASSPDLLLRNLPSLVHSLDPDQPAVNLRTLEQVQADWLAPSRLTAVMVGLFAALALVIAALGVGSVVAFAVAERTQEIGIRSVLGATPGEILGLIVRQTLPLLVGGLALGVLASLWLTRLLASQLFGVAPNDPATLAAVAAAFAAVFVFSALVPARRAARIDPVLALKS